jgi:hypothetical protein
MMPRLPLICSVAALLAALALPRSAAAQVLPSRGTAILPPAECPDTPGCLERKAGTFTPCYSPLTPISTRWETTRETPYYPGFCPHFGKGRSCCTGEAEIAGGGGPVAGDYGTYTGGRRDEAFLRHLGATGPYVPATTDIIDAIGGHHDHPAPCPH